MLEAGDSISSPSFSLPLSVVLSDVVTKPDCNCLYPKATPSSDPASASPHQPPAPSMAPLAGLAWDDSQRTEGSSLLPSELPLRIEDPGSAKQRPPRSTCQTLQSTEQPNHGNRLTEDSQPHPSAGGPIPGVEDILESSLGTNWVLEEASGEGSEGFLTQEAKFSPSKPIGGSIQAETDRSRAFPASPFPKSTEDQQPADITDMPLTEVNPMRPTGQTQNNTPEKTDGSSKLPGDHQEPRSPHTATPNPQRVSNSATPFAQLLLPKSHSWGIVLPLGELKSKRSTRDRRSPAELEGGPANEGAARPVARFNSIPLTDTGHVEQHEGSSDPQIPESVFHLLVPGIILVLLAVGGLLFYRWKRRVRRTPGGEDILQGQNKGWVGYKEAGDKPGSKRLCSCWKVGMTGQRVEGSDGAWLQESGVARFGGVHLTLAIQRYRQASDLLVGKAGSRLAKAT